jgi:hypothetical protein
MLHDIAARWISLDFGLAYHRLLAASHLQSKQVAQDIAHEFGTSLLLAEFVSDEHLDFICRALLDPVLAQRPGLEELVVMLQIDRDKLSERQRERLFARLASIFGNLADEDLAFMIGNFIARVAGPDHALEMLLDMTAKATSRQALAGVFLGLDILDKKHRSVHGITLDRPGRRRSSDLRN